MVTLMLTLLLLLLLLVHPAHAAEVDGQLRLRARAAVRGALDAAAAEELPPCADDVTAVCKEQTVVREAARDTLLCQCPVGTDCVKPNFSDVQHGRSPVRFTCAVPVSEPLIT